MSGFPNLGFWWQPGTNFFFFGKSTFNFSFLGLISLFLQVLCFDKFRKFLVAFFGLFYVIPILCFILFKTHTSCNKMLCNLAFILLFSFYLLNSHITVTCHCYLLCFFSCCFVVMALLLFALLLLFCCCCFVNVVVHMHYYYLALLLLLFCCWFWLWCCCCCYYY